MSADNDKPFACNAPGCGMRFTNEDHLTVHKRKHEMSLALNSTMSSAKAIAQSSLFVDQTPTPTKFLRNCDEIGLFHELNKNPFEEAFKKASDGLSSGLPPLPGPTLDTPQALDTPTSALLHHMQKLISVPLPGPTLDTPTHVLNTPTPALLRPLAPLARVESEDIPELSTDNIMTIPMTEAMTPVPTTTRVLATMANNIVRVKEEPMDTTSVTSFGVASPDQLVDAPSPQTEVELFSNGVSSVPFTQPVVSPPVMAPTQHTAPSTIPVPMATLSPQILKSGQVATVQMFIQLPNGQTIPISLPAAMASPQTSSPQIVPTNGVDSDVTVAAATSSSALTKQKLKAALSQSTTQQNILNSNMMVMTEAVERVTSMESMMLGSPNLPSMSIPTIVAAATPRENVVSPAESDFSFCDPDSTIPGKRSRLSEDDPDDRRRKFLERNRAAAARCRYKRKNWINGLEKKSDDLITTNQKLTSEITLLRTEIAQLKSLLLAHKSCPVTLQQQQQGLNLVTSIGEVDSSSASSSPGVTLVNTKQNKTTPIAMVPAKLGTSTLQASPVPVTLLSHNNIPIASASNAVSLATVASTSVAGGVNPTYIIVTNQPAKGQS